MSRLDTPARVTVKPGMNVYTGLAALSALSTLAALGYAIWQYRVLLGS